MKSALCLLLGLTIGAAGAWYGPRFFAPAQMAAPPTKLPMAAAATTVKALGRIVPRDGIVEIGALPTELIKEISVKEGQDVEAGDSLAKLSSYELLEAKINALQAQLSEAKIRARAEHDLLQSQIRQADLAIEEARLSEFDIRSQQQQIELLTKKLEQDRAELGRLERGPEALVSEQDRERQRLAVQQSEAQVAGARQNLQKLQAATTLAVRAAEAQKEVLEMTEKRIDAQLPVDSLEAEIAGLREQQRQSLLKATRGGRILEISAHEGELVGNRAILRMANLDEMAVVAEVYESAKSDIRPGQTATITSSALRQELLGEVVKISQMIASPQVRSLDPFAPADRRVFEVLVLFKTPEGHRVARDLVNAPVDVSFDTPSQSAPSP